MTVLVKICGLTTQNAVDAAVEYGAAFLGFVFYPKSPRHISPDMAYALTDSLAKPVGTVAVIVDPTLEALAEITDSFVPGYLQLHGSESPETIARIRAFLKDQNLGHIHIIKAISVRSADDIAAAHRYEAVADMLMFDAKAPAGLPGGNGLSFDWNMLAGRSFAKPWFLSGGLNAANVAEALRITGARMVDVSSSIESEPGRKDPALIKEFIERAKSA